MTTVNEPVVLDGIGMVPMQAPAPMSIPEPEPIDPKYLDLLRELGFTEVPTAAEVKQLLDERRTLTRNTVLIQADKGSWCYDGTRRVLANLRLPRVDQRENHTVRATVTFTVEYATAAYTRESAVEVIRRAYLTPEALRSRIGGFIVGDVNVTPIEQEEKP